MQIILATHNRGKMKEMSSILAHLPVKLLTLDDFPQIGEITETGATLKENAFIKAETVHQKTGLPALADDTGLEETLWTVLQVCILPGMMVKQPLLKIIVEKCCKKWMVFQQKSELRGFIQ